MHTRMAWAAANDILEGLSKLGNDAEDSDAASIASSTDVELEGWE
jgi:hypothetical protein